jgi:N-acetyl-gamma-glutamyl-phosphate reductase
VVDSKSGTSGAGRTLGLPLHFAEAGEGVSAYALGGHRHLPEIVQELSLLREAPPLGITFVPHLLPITRGILSTCYAPLAKGMSGSQEGIEKRVRQAYREFYKGEPFVRIVEAPPQTKHTRGNNLCLVHPTVDGRTGRLVVVSSLDNLVKGAAGQAIQNMNLMLGLPETTGLDELGLYP